IIAGIHRRDRADASVNPHPPNAGDGGARAATSFVANFMRSEDARDEPPTSARAKLEAKRTRIESERQRNIDLVIKQIIGEDDARERIVELRAQRLQVGRSHSAPSSSAMARHFPGTAVRL